MLKRLLQQFLIFGFTALFCVILVAGILRIRAQGEPVQEIAATVPTPTTPAKPPIPTPSAPPAPTPIAATGTFDGDRYRIPWGIVSASIDVKNGKITGVRMPDVPDSPPSINAKDTLIRQAIAAGSANIQGVSGATYTSTGFKQSLESAIAKAGI